MTRSKWSGSNVPEEEAVAPDVSSPPPSTPPADPEAAPEPEKPYDPTSPTEKRDPPPPPPLTDEQKVTQADHALIYSLERAVALGHGLAPDKEFMGAAAARLRQLTGLKPDDDVDMALINRGDDSIPSPTAQPKPAPGA